MSQIFLAVDHMHSHQVVHRDLKVSPAHLVSPTESLVCII